MSDQSVAAVASATDECEFVTFGIGDLLLGVDVGQVQEINRQLSVTAVPHAMSWVSGVVNLRGDVVTVIDLRTLLGLPQAGVTHKSRNVIIDAFGEKIGLIVDNVGDVVYCKASELEPPPANISGVDGRFFVHIHRMESGLLTVLDTEEVLACQEAGK